MQSVTLPRVIGNVTTSLRDRYQHERRVRFLRNVTKKCEKQQKKKKLRFPCFLFICNIDSAKHMLVCVAERAKLLLGVLLKLPHDRKK